MYDNPSDTDPAYQVDRCAEPPAYSLHEGLEWDEGNRAHFRERLRLSPREVDIGIDGGYLFSRDDPQECRYQYLFRLEPSSLARQSAIYRLIIDTSRGTLRPITAFEETHAGSLKKYTQAQQRGGLE